ncbi:MAG: T9SS type A sorting domain-containing protein, partial [Ferruginibacter sp.]|nr:T9SS type A sorting domain-containing protein [Ferruginibacter sp.]
LVLKTNTPTLTLNGGTLQVYGNITRTAGNINGANGTVEMNGTGAQGIPALLFAGNNLKNLVIGNSNNVSGVTIQGTLDIYRSLTFSAPGLKLTTGNFLTFKSTATETAWLGDVTGKTIAGSATVERFIPTGINHGKSWQLLAVPVRGAQSVKAAWQENNLPLVVGTAGLGTTISSEKPGATTRGFDFLTPAGGPSMKSYNPATNTYVGIDDGVTNTSALPIANQRGYLLLVRGDRSVQTSATAANPTTLRTFGGLFTATGGETPPVTTVLPNKFETIGNPYPSAIDFTQVTRAVGVDDVFYLWDPLLPGGGGYGLGGYQTVSGVVGYLPTPGSTNYPAMTPVNKIQSGQAFFVHGTAGGNVSFTEASKVAGSSLVLRPAPPQNVRLLRLNLYDPAVSAYGAIDGNVIAFNKDFDNRIDPKDALKLMNTNENAGIWSNDTSLAIEARKPVHTNDTIFYKLSHLRQRPYQFRFGPQNLNYANLSAWFADRFLQTMTPVSLTDSTVINFTVTADAASAAGNRFYLVFRKLEILPVVFTHVSANRNSEKNIVVDWKVQNDAGIEKYEIERSGEGRNFSKLTSLLPKLNTGTPGSYEITDEKFFSGDNFYRIKAYNTSGEAQSSAIVKVAPVTTNAAITVYPNPLVNKTLNVSFLNQAPGAYHVQLRNKLGQLVMEKTFQVKGGNTTESIALGNEIAAGNYQLIIVTEKGTKTTQQVIVN